MGDVEILFVSYQSDPNKVTQGYPAQVDTFPDTGPDTPGLQHPPAVASAVGGIPDQAIGRRGFPSTDWGFPGAGRAGHQPAGG